MKQQDVDKLRKSIEFEKLSEDERKKLLKDFKDHGGKDVMGSGSTKTLLFDKEKQKELYQKLARRSATKLDEHELEAYFNSRSGGYGRKKKHLTGYFPRVVLHWQSVFGKIKQSGGFVHPNFLLTLKNTAQSELLNIQLVIHTVTQLPEQGTKKLREELIKNNPLHFEILYRMQNFYDEAEINSILGNYAQNPNSKISFNMAAKGLKSLFKKIYIYRNFTNMILDALTTAMEIETKHHILPEKIASTAETLKQVRASLNFLFKEFYEKLRLAYMCSIDENLPTGDPLMDKLVDLEVEEIISYLTESGKIKNLRFTSIKGDKTDSEISDEAETDEEEEEEKKEELPVEIERGLSLIEKLNFTVNRGELDKDNPKYYFDENDKMLHVLVILNEFEKEYSFVLTSSKITMNVDYESGAKQDIKKELEEQYIHISSCRNSLDEYSRIVKEAFDVENDHAMAIGKKSQLLQNFSVQQSKISVTTRKTLSTVMSKIQKSLKTAIDKKDKIIVDPERKLNFDDFDGKKKMDGWILEEVIKQTYHFVSGFTHLLQQDRLSGSGNMIEYFDN